MSYESLSHSKWECKYPVVFVPKYRKKVLYGKIRKFLRPVFHELAGQRRSKILERHSEVVGYIKGKSAIETKNNWKDKVLKMTGSFNRTTEV